MNKLFVLFDSDILYATRFLEYFKVNKDTEFEVTVFTNKNSLEEFIQVYPIEILLLGEEACWEEREGGSIRFIYRLSENPKKDANGEEPFIYRYQPAQSLMKEIMKDYTARTCIFWNNTPSEQKQFISIYSPISSIEKLSFSWAFCSLISKKNKSLFVLLDPLPIQLLRPLGTSTQSLTEYIYYLKENTNSLDKLNSLVEAQGDLFYLRDILHGFDILSLNKEDMEKWIKELREQSDYSSIVFYLGCYNEAMVEIIKQSDTVLLPIEGSLYEEVVLKEWKRQLGQLGIRMKQEKYIHLDHQDIFNNLPISFSELQSSTAWSHAEELVTDSTGDKN